MPIITTSSQSPFLPLFCHEDWYRTVDTWVTVYPSVDRLTPFSHPISWVPHWGAPLMLAVAETRHRVTVAKIQTNIHSAEGLQNIQSTAWMTKDNVSLDSSFILSMQRATYLIKTYLQQWQQLSELQKHQASFQSSFSVPEWEVDTPAFRSSRNWGELKG